LTVSFLSEHSRGIGFATVRHLLRANAKVYLGARSESKASEAIKILHEEGLGKGGEGSKGEVKWLEVDLSDPREAKRCAEGFLKIEERLDVLGR